CRCSSSARSGSTRSPRRGESRSNRTPRRPRTTRAETMRAADWMIALALCAAVPCFGVSIAAGGTTIVLDFAQPKQPGRWSIRSREWKVADGMLRGKGDGALEFAGPIDGDFTLTFQGWSAEKTNFEVKLVDAADGHDLYTFAFLGRYHGVLDGVKCCILRG